MEEGRYIATAKDDLNLPESTEHWIKGRSYSAVVEVGGVLHLCGEMAWSHYVPDAVESLKGVFEFRKD